MWCTSSTDYESMEISHFLLTHGLRFIDYDRDGFIQALDIIESKRVYVRIDKDLMDKLAEGEL